VCESAAVAKKVDTEIITASICVKNIFRKNQNFNNVIFVLKNESCLNEKSFEPFNSLSKVVR